MVGAVALLAVLGLAGCRTSPGVAAYVGGSDITVTQLDAAVDARTAAQPAIAAYDQAHPADFPRKVLGALVSQRVYQAAADRYGVSVDDDQVDQRITQLLAGASPAQEYAQLAGQGISRTDVFENVRQQLVRVAIAREQGKAGALSDASLRQAYAQAHDSLTQKQYGYITVPDQATAATVVAQLQADPGSYAALAAQHPGQTTAPDLQSTATGQVPQPLADAITAAGANTASALPAIQGVDGVLVLFVGQVATPTFEQARTQLELQAEQTVSQDAASYVDAVQKSLKVTVNPRYGALGSDGSVAPATGGVVQLLGSSGSAASASAAPTGSAGG